MFDQKCFFKLICFVTEGFFIANLFFILPKVRGDCELFQPGEPNETKRQMELLNIIKPLNGLIFEVKDVIAPTEYTYNVSICSHIEGSEPNVAAVQYTKEKNVSLGKSNMVDIMGGTDWILLTYYGGDKYENHCTLTGRVTQIMIICDPKVLKGKFEILEERRLSSNQSNCYYLFELGSNVSCTLKKEEILPQKLSSGSVFCILLFTIVSVYLICGFLYKRIVIGAKGLEQIPNYTFWRDFGNLQADGCDYICRCGPRQESQAYRGIDDHLKMDEERDDQLLNM